MPPPVNVLMIADQPLIRYTQAGPLPPVQVGQAFWVTSRQQQSLIDGGLAHDAPEGTPEPLAEIAQSASGMPGFGAGTSNNSR